MPTEGRPAHPLQEEEPEIVRIALISGDEVLLPRTGCVLVGDVIRRLAEERPPPPGSAYALVAGGCLVDGDAPVDTSVGGSLTAVTVPLPKALEFSSAVAGGGHDERGRRYPSNRGLFFDFVARSDLDILGLEIGLCTDVPGRVTLSARTARKSCQGAESIAELWLEVGAVDIEVPTGLPEWMGNRFDFVSTQLMLREPLHVPIGSTRGFCLMASDGCRIAFAEEGSAVENDELRAEPWGFLIGEVGVARWSPGYDKFTPAGRALYRLA